MYTYYLTYKIQLTLIIKYGILHVGNAFHLWHLKAMEQIKNMDISMNKLRFMITILLIYQYNSS